MITPDMVLSLEEEIKKMEHPNEMIIAAICERLGVKYEPT